MPHERHGGDGSSRSTAASDSARRRHQQQPTSTSARSSSARGAQQQRHPRLSDRQLVETAQAAAASIDWRALRAASVAWRVTKRTRAVVGGGAFTVAAHRHEREHQLLATGSLACSVAELAHVLWTTRDERFLAAMSELHGASFLGGAVVRRVASGAALASPPTAATSSRSAGDVDVSVKTATFAKPHVFARDERWCFVDLFDMRADRSRFRLTLQSLRAADALPEDDAGGGGGRRQIHDVTAGYSVVADARSDVVWVAFYARFVDAAPSAAEQLRASPSATAARLRKMADALCRLPAVVQRRRLGAQVFAHPAALGRPPQNAHCTCCTAALPLLAPKKRCHLCGYRVCAKCVAKQQLERSAHYHHGRRRLQTVRVCAKCSQRVNAANYDDLPAGLASPPAVQRDAPGGQSLADYLRRSFERAAADVPRRRALMQVARSLLEDEHASGRSRSDTVASPRRAADTVDAKCLRGSGDAAALLDRFEREFATPFALEDCEVAHADDTRSYSLDYADDGVGDEVDGGASFPVPSDERARVAFVERLAGVADTPELDIICAIASQELQCAAGLVTVVAGDAVHVVAASARAFRGLVVPRADSMCSHVPMSDKPLLVPHPAADVRFCRMPAVLDGAVRFYCGFPLRSRANVVFGAVCCVDTKPRGLTQSEYAVMAKLAGLTARILETQCATWATAAA